MSSYTIIVDFTVDAADMAAFLPLMLANARTSLQLEDGCERFDVLRPEGSDNRVLLYEIYQDRVAFDLHATSAHYLAFAAATHALIRHKVVTVCDRVADRFPAVAA